MKRRRFSWKTLRVIVQVFAFLLVGAYFLGLVYPLEVSWRPDLLFQLDPLTHLYLLLSGNGIPHWIWALVALVLLFAVSRIFCGWLCPLGAMLDLVSGIRGRLKLFNRSRLGPATDQASTARSRPRQRSVLPANFDLYLLITLLVLTLLGSPLLWVLDPIVFSFKFLTVAVLPIIDGPLRLLYNNLDSAFYMAEWWHPVQDGYNAWFSVSQEPVYTDTVLFLLFAAVIFGLEFFQRRFWCRYICPLGALLRLTYRFHPLRRRINPDCAYCLSCEQACHFGGTGEHDCFYCMECIDHCAPGRISFLPNAKSISAAASSAATDPTAAAVKPDVATGPAPARTSYRARISGELPPAHISRRLMLEYAALGLIAYPALRLFDNRTELPLDFIRPPGVGEDEARFNELCIKCGQCLKVCLTNGLQPALTEAGLSALWTPRLISRLGECEWNCNLCGQVCPTGAIPNLPLEEKQQFRMGVAVIDKMRCIPYITNHNCAVCEEHCPTADKSIKYQRRMIDGPDGEPMELLRPIVDEQLCTGCGICERVCPVPGLAAVRVYRRPPGPAYDDANGEYEAGYGSGMGGGYGDYP